jgi:hypothetical protein
MRYGLVLTFPTRFTERSDIFLPRAIIEARV